PDTPGTKTPDIPDGLLEEYETFVGLAQHRFFGTPDGRHLFGYRSALVRAGRWGPAPVSVSGPGHHGRSVRTTR
ncbi:hypothetical protein ACWDRR_43495, partial [Kitasatospora sp. NPDC003701]